MQESEAASGRAPLSLSDAWKAMPVSHRLMMAIMFVYFISALLVQLFAWGRHQPMLNVGLIALAMVSLLAISIWHSVVVKGAKPTVAFFLIAIVISWIAEFVGHNYGWFFGHYNYTKTLGPAIGGVPVIITVTWSFILYTAFMLIDWLIGTGGKVPARSRWGRTLWSGIIAAGTATLVCAWDLIVDPIATSGVWWTAAGKDPWWYWFYGGPYLRELPGKAGLGMPGVPIGNFVGWWLAPFFIVFIFCLFFQKQNRVVGSLVNTLPLLVYFYIYITLIPIALEMNWLFNGMDQVALIGTFAMMPVIMLSAIKLFWEYSQP